MNTNVPAAAKLTDENNTHTHRQTYAGIRGQRLVSRSCSPLCCTLLLCSCSIISSMCVVYLPVGLRAPLSPWRLFDSACSSKTHALGVSCGCVILLRRFLTCVACVCVLAEPNLSREYRDRLLNVWCIWEPAAFFFLFQFENIGLGFMGFEQWLSGGASQNCCPIHS